MSDLPPYDPDRFVVLGLLLLGVGSSTWLLMSHPQVDLGVVFAVLVGAPLLAGFAGLGVVRLLADIRARRAYARAREDAETAARRIERARTGLVGIVQAREPTLEELLPGRRLPGDPRVVEGRRGGATVRATEDAQGRLRLEVVPDREPRLATLEPRPRSRDPRLARLSGHGCLRIEPQGALVAASFDELARHVAAPTVVELLDLLIDLVARPAGALRPAIEVTPASEPGVVCPWCRDDLAVDDPAATACPRCATRHHADCFVESGGCTVLGCAAKAGARARA